MKSEKEQLLYETYNIFKQLCFYDCPIAQSKEYIFENVMGYGTHIDEKIFSIPDFNELLQLQRDQSVGLEMKVNEQPVFKKMLINGDAAVFVEEILISICFYGN